MWIMLGGKLPVGFAGEGGHLRWVDIMYSLWTSIHVLFGRGTTSTAPGLLQYG